jgi:hypothetical protein
MCICPWQAWWTGWWQSQRWSCGSIKKLRKRRPVTATNHRIQSGHSNKSPDPATKAAGAEKDDTRNKGGRRDLTKESQYPVLAADEQPLSTNSFINWMMVLADLGLV